MGAEILKVLKLISSDYKGVEPIRALVEEQMAKTGFEGIPTQLSESRIIFESNIYNQQAGILHRQLENGGEVVVNGKKTKINHGDYSVLTYLGDPERFGKYVPIKEIEKTTGVTINTIQRIAPALRRLLHGDLEEGIERIIGSPGDGYCFTDPTPFTIKRNKNGKFITEEDIR